MLVKLPTLALVLLCACLITGKAQTQRSFSSTDTTINAVVHQYNLARNENLLLYNGVEYAHSYPHTTGHPFFLTDTFQRSSLVYDGVLYNDVPLAYDIANNEVVIKNKDSFLIRLVYQKVDSFLFRNHAFVSLTQGSLPENGSLSPGIYDMYYYGDSVTVLVHHQKFLLQAGNAGDPDRFRSVDDYIAKVNGNYYPVSNNNSLEAAFARHGDEVKNFLRAHHLNIKKHREDILEVAGYYAQLNN